MRKVENLKQLADAVELLTMLEQLSSGLAKGDQTTQEIPWGGIKLTLGQAKSLVLKTYDSLCQSNDVERFPEEPRYRSEDARFAEGSNSEVAANGVETEEDSTLRGLSALAGRIQKAPTSSGRVRELVQGSSKDNSATAAEQRRRQGAVSASGEA